jgi:hypothetical protein
MRRPPTEVVDFSLNLTRHVPYAFRRFYPARMRSQVLRRRRPRSVAPGANYSPDSPRIVFRRGHDQRPVVAESGSTQAIIFRLPAQVQVVWAHFGEDDGGDGVKKPVASGRD